MPTDSWIEAAWMQTYTGRKFFPTAPQIEDINIVDIAHALSLTCRYGGHVSRFYSVAEHCIHMSSVVAPENALWALLHDATEAYVGDMVRPLKIQIPEYREIEDRIMELIAEKYELDPQGAQMPPEVKDADNRILLNERWALMSMPPEGWDMDHLTPLPIGIWALAPKAAEQTYLNRFDSLMARRG